jgi:hypothetical protein
MFSAATSEELVHNIPLTKAYDFFLLLYDASAPVKEPVLLTVPL